MHEESFVQPFTYKGCFRQFFVCFKVFDFYYVVGMHLVCIVFEASFCMH